MKFESSSEALDWMIEHPLEHVYDEYGNYAVYIEDSNTVESFWFTGDWEDDEGNFEPGYWDMDKYAPEEFVEAFEDTPLETLD